MTCACLVVEDDSALKLHIETHKDRQYECPFCDSTLQHEHFVRHLLTHSSEPYHHCDQCGKNFSGKVQLSRHKLVHVRQKKKEKKKRKRKASSSDENEDTGIEGLMKYRSLKKQRFLNIAHNVKNRSRKVLS